MHCLREYRKQIRALRSSLVVPRRRRRFRAGPVSQRLSSQVFRQLFKTPNARGDVTLEFARGMRKEVLHGSLRYLGFGALLRRVVGRRARPRLELWGVRG